MTDMEIPSRGSLTEPWLVSNFIPIQQSEKLLLNMKLVFQINSMVAEIHRYKFFELWFIVYEEQKTFPLILFLFFPFKKCISLQLLYL